MKVFIAIFALVALAAASPSAIVPYAYHAGAPLGHDGRVVDTPEVAHAKAAHLAAHAHEAAKTAGHGYAAHGDFVYGAPAYGHAYGYAAPIAHAYAATPALAYGAHYAHGHGAPLGHDGRVVDTPEVAHAKAAHLAAHAHEAAKTAHYGYAAHGYAPVAALGYAAPAYGHGYGYGAPIGHDGRVVDTPEVAHAKAAHFAAHAQANAHAHHYW
ncbi:cuticle protein 5-like [Athalia rosae]|uniref:cuticle protein 5-like n=1 Tax=Athalia rosae TaxID=37344 RepID=UPI000625078B|nr:cuticle protein 5-like [Athalia rosae]